MNDELQLFDIQCKTTGQLLLVKSRLFMHRMLEQLRFLHLPLLQRLNG
jgi:hypothetical protein